MDPAFAPGAVVVGIDGSVSSDRAVEWAAREAGQDGRPLVVLHAAPPGTQGDAVDLGYASADRAREVAPGLDVHRLVQLGYPLDLLSRASQTASVVVVGARGRNPFASHVLGSVSQALITRSECPLVVVRRTRESPAGHTLPVVVGVDGTRASAAAVEFAFRHSARSGAPLVIAHVDWDPLPYSAAMERSFTAEERKSFLEADELAVSDTIAGLGKRYPDVDVTETYRSGDPAQVLAEQSQDSSMVVVCAHGHRMSASLLLGSIGRRLVAQASSPVAVVRR
jgi:nucleotide-binding universal stress UspA family protein